MEEKNIFAEKMREARIKTGFSQAELSKRTGISAATLSTYESSEKPKNPPIDKAIAIAKSLNVSLDWLCGLDNPKKTDESLTTEEVLDAIMTLSKLSNSDIGADYKNYENMGNFVNISLFDDALCDFVTEYMKIRSFMSNPDYPDYLKSGLKKALLDKFINHYQIYNGSFVSNAYVESLTSKKSLESTDLDSIIPF